ncbi:putative phosphoglycerate mutase pmu1 [Lithohypha guttulata]|uniref:putative phosphoglycerate mutase pmu1 n=1 Tax=Lithohypha guttulata TaxID=1690604 RepID=UPI002DE0F909|nr:putative phosphoglycerate mutase pmu1 [Lithohypha guttulata]
MNEMNSTAQNPSQLPVSEEKYTASSRVNTHYSFTAPGSYFLPSLPSTDPATFDPTTTNFGLISQSYESDSSLPLLHFGDHHVGKPTDWQRFDHHLKTLNTQADANASYHILYLARHGQGYHNLAESYYGPAAWDCHWAELDGDPDPASTISWSDAHLSKLGQRQAQEQSKFWIFQLSKQGMPLPHTWFVSPMNRACKTLEITFRPLAETGVVQDWKPTVKEYLRETNGIHTCDRRSPRSVIADTFPQYTIESNFTEQDELWDPIYRETDTAHTHRAALVLDDILSSIPPEETDYISITAHGGMINAILRAVGHRQFTVRVGSAIAVLVKAEKLDGKRPEQHFGNGITKPDCVEDPLKAGLPGYKSLKDYVDGVEAGA